MPGNSTATAVSIRANIGFLIDRQTFDACQDLLSGKNRRMSHHVHVFSGGIIRCAHCGFAVTGERIQSADFWTGALVSTSTTGARTTASRTTIRR